MEPEEDPQIALRMALAQQALMRAKIKRQREQEAKKKKRMSGFEKNKSRNHRLLSGWRIFLRAVKNQRWIYF